MPTDAVAMLQVLMPFGPTRKLDEELVEVNNLYHLIATNSLLNHLPDPTVTISGLANLLTVGAVWLAGHEPSSRSYRSPEIPRCCDRFEAGPRWRRYLNPMRYLDRLGMPVDLHADLLGSTAWLTVEHGLVWRSANPYAGPHYQGSVPASCAGETRRQGRRFPHDGANFCAVWRRIS